MSPTKHALNFIAGALGLYALTRLAILPAYKLVHLGLREHGSFLEDLEFYYTLVAQSLLHFGGWLGIAFCIAGIACAFTTVLGLKVDRAARERARLWFWYVPVFCFFLEMVGRYLVQIWYANHGLIFPSTSFLRDCVPHLWWLIATWLITAPAIVNGRGLLLFVPSPEPPVPEPKP